MTDTVATPSTDALLQERHTTHGSFGHNAMVSQLVKVFIKDQAATNGVQFTNVQAEAIDQIALKLSRIVSNPNNADNWADIAGYAQLAVLEATGTLGDR